MDPLPPIPTPPGQHWREFRIKVLPFLMFGCVVAGAAFIWRYLIMPTNLVGQVESITASVTTTAPGLLSELRVDRFSEVTNGQPIAVVLPFDPELTKASLAAIESDLNVTKGRMDLNELARLDTTIRLKLDLDTQRTLLNVAVVQRDEAEMFSSAWQNCSRGATWSPRPNTSLPKPLTTRRRAKWRTVPCW